MSSEFVTTIRSKKFMKFMMYSLFAFLFLFLLFLFSLFCISFLLEKRNGSLRNGEPNFYQYYEYRDSTNQTSVGFITLESSLSDDEFISYRDDDNYVLITNFEVERYKCTGSCYCSEGRRMSTTIPLVRGLIYLVTGITSIVAASRAREYFISECKNEISSLECPEHAISAKFERCEPISDGSSRSGEVEDDTNKSFECRGNCMSFPYYDGINGYFPLRNGKLIPAYRQPKGAMMQQFIGLKKDASAFGCETMSNMVRYNPHSTLASKEGFDTMREYAEKKFMMEDLNSFCQMQSMVSPNVVSQEFYDTVTKATGNKFKFPLCVGWVRGENPTVKCIDIL